ncbi:MAG: BMP family ABC transporter substrate-binding protein [Lachnospiraceae bacterium]
MKSKNKFALFLLLVLTIMLFSGCKKAEDPSANTTPDASSATDASITENPTEADLSDKDDYRVLCLLNGTLGDKGYYDNMAGGLNRLHNELGWDVKIIEMSKDEAYYESYFLEASESGEWDLIVTGTFSVKNLLEQTAVKFPKQKYMIVDVAVDFSVVTTNNVIGVTFMSNETGFMGGALAALMWSESSDAKLDATKPILGFVGSVDAPHINDFLIGYMEGIQYVNPNIKLLTDYVGSFGDVPRCLEITTEMYKQGAQIVYAPASQSILGAVQASEDADKFFVACDTDIWTISEDTDPELVENVLSSTEKKVGDSIFAAVKGLKEGTYKIGENYVLGIKDGAVGLADNANYQKLVPQSIRNKLTEISQEIARGEIVVDTAFGMDSKAVAALRNSMKP